MNFRFYFLFAILILLINTTSCSNVQRIPPKWTYFNFEEVSKVKSLAVIAGKYDSKVSHCILKMLKAVINNLELMNRYKVKSYRDVFVSLESHQVNVSTDSPKIDRLTFELLNDRLKTDVVIILSMKYCNSYLGGQLTLAMYSTNGGKLLGKFSTFEPGSRKQYSLSKNTAMISKRAIDALLLELVLGTNSSK